MHASDCCRLKSNLNGLVVTSAVSHISVTVSGSVAKVTVTATFTPPTVTSANPAAALTPSLPSNPTVQLKMKTSASSSWVLVGNPVPMDNTTVRLNYSKTIMTSFTTGNIFGADVLGTWVVSGYISDSTSVTQ